MEATLNPSVRFYAIISARSDEATAKELVTVVEEMVKEKVTTETKELATKSDLFEGLAGVRKELAEGLADGSVKLAEGLAGVRREIAEVKSDLIRGIAESKADMIKWMFLFWIGQMVVTFGFILLFLKK